MSRTLIMTAMLAGLCPGPAMAQPTAGGPPVATFASSVDLVRVSAVVRDRKGRFVEDLTAADFEVLDAGQARPITEFRRDDAGVSIALLLAFGCSNPDLVVQGDPGIDYSQYKSFSLAKSKPSTLGGVFVNYTIEDELNAKGMKETADKPDLLVFTQVGRGNEQMVDGTTAAIRRRAAAHHSRDDRARHDLHVQAARLRVHAGHAR